MSTEICANCKHFKDKSDIQINIGICQHKERPMMKNNDYVRGLWSCKHFERKKDKE